MRLLQKSNFPYIFILFLTISYSSTIFAQSDPTLFAWFDHAVGEENLGIYNGRLHVNTYRTPDKSNNMYYQSDTFVNGDVSYDNQFYYDIALKYDLLNDELIVRPIGETYRAVTTIKSKTDSFFYYGKPFVNLDNDKNRPAFINGYYEISLKGDRLTFYIKHKKDVQEKIVGSSNLSVFKASVNFVLYYKNAYSEINSRKALLAIFPEYKSNIKKFYADNATMDKANHTLFMENLMKYINNLPQ